MDKRQCKTVNPKERDINELSLALTPAHGLRLILGHRTCRGNPNRAQWSLS